MIHASRQPGDSSRIGAAALGEAILLTINVLSLDAVAVALTWQTVLGRVAHLPPTAVQRTLLSAVVGFIYLLDRQLDAAKLTSLCRATARHAGHRRFALLVRPIIPACAVIAVALTPFLTRQVVIAGGILACLTAAHLLIVQLAPSWLSRGRKELSVGILFAAGCGIHAIAAQPLNGLLLAAITLVGMLLAFNCLAIGTWEAESDQAQGWSSVRVEHLPRLGGWLMLISLVCAVLANRSIGESVAAAALLLVALNQVRSRHDSLSLRVAADLVLLTPLLWMI